jgi:hypothetical protein
MTSRDPRIPALLERLKEVDPEGRPTQAAMLAQRVRGYLVEIQGLRKDLAHLATEINDMDGRASVLSERLNERGASEADLRYEAQDAAVRAAMAGSGSASASLHKRAAEHRRRVNEFEKDLQGDRERLAAVQSALKLKREAERSKRELIARRMNTIDALLNTAEDGLAGTGQQSATRRHAPAGQKSPERGRRVRRVRVVRRR